MVAILLPWRLIQHLDLHLLHLLLCQSSAHYWPGFDDAVLRLQLLGLSRVRTPDRHHRLFDRLRVRAENIRRYQSRLKVLYHIHDVFGNPMTRLTQEVRLDQSAFKS